MTNVVHHITGPGEFVGCHGVCDVVPEFGAEQTVRTINGCGNGAMFVQTWYFDVPSKSIGNR
jgi:hypothetical protein